MKKLQRSSGCGCGKMHYGSCPTKSDNKYGYGFGKSHHDSCPPAPESDVVKSNSTGCEVTPFPVADDFLQTVILANFNLNIPVEAEIKLPVYANDIKEIRKNVHLTQLKAVPNASTDEVVTLFVEGYVHKNIQFSDGSGYLRDYAVNVPFKCYRRIDLENPAEFPFTSSKNSSNFELRELAKNKMESNRCEFGSRTFEFFNNPIEGRLLFSSVDQWDIAHNFDYKGRFNKITEKMDVTLAIMLTQKQPVDVAGNGNGGEAPSVADRYRDITGQ